MDIVTSIVSKMPGIGKVQHKFLITLFTTLLVTRGKMTFRNMARYSAISQKTYYRHYADTFDFVSFNRQLIDETFSKNSERILVFDPSFIKKSGKKTHGKGYFYNSCHHRAEPGLEIGVLALVDLSYHTALCLSVRQSLPASKQTEQTMLDQYIDHITAVVPQLHDKERTLVVDGSLMREKVLDAADDLSLCLIGKLRRDARMRYYYEGPRRASGRGLQKIYGPQVDWQNLSNFEDAGIYNGQHLYTKVLNHKLFKRKLRVVVLVDPAKKAPHNYVLLASTDINMDASTICRYYQARYQIEFLFRDAKQYTGLEDAQTRTNTRLAFHFNASLSALNIARSELLNAHHPGTPFVCSMASVKARYFNEHYLKHFFDLFHIDADRAKESEHYQYLCNYGAIAA